MVCACKRTGQQRGLLTGQRKERQRLGMTLLIQFPEYAARQEGIDEVLLARGRHEHQGPLLASASDEREKSEAHLVRPVHVLEYEEHGPSRDKDLAEPGHGLEEAELIVARNWQASPVQFGQQTREFRSPYRWKRVEERLIVKNLRATKGVDPRPERE